MPELPFLLFPRPTVIPRGVPPRGRSSFTKPTPAQQRARLQTKFDDITNSFLNLQTTVAGIDPEQVIVLETLTTSVENLARAAAQIPGLEWLAERELDEVPPEFGFTDGEEAQTSVPRRLYALMSNQSGMGQLLGLWNEWTANPAKRAKSKFGAFKTLFELLRDIRRWGPQDRIEATGILEKWREEIAINAIIRFEVEFWFRDSLTRRQSAYTEVQTLVEGLGGSCLDQAEIPEIRYHATLVEMPGGVVGDFIDGIAVGNYPALLRSGGVMFFRPRAQSAFGLRPYEQVTFDLAERVQDRPIEEGEPVLAVLDGVPVENHTALTNRLSVDDPDGFAAKYQPGQQQHGTAMASLVVHGDLNAEGPALKRKVYVRPIYYPDSFNNESAPVDRLLVDLIHRAIRRLYEGDGEQDAVAPTVRIVNLSLGNPEQPFDREISPLGRLLDWLSWKHKVLIVVSIGNRVIPINVGNADLQNLPDEEAVSLVIRAMQRDQLQRRPLSPAEAINCISVGAVHADACPTFVAGARVDLLRGRRLPALINTIASGFRRATKPEILLPGGRLLYQQNPPPADAGVFGAVESLLAPGIMTATPGVAPLELNRVKHSCGTSNAAALASRCAALAYERLSVLDVPADCEPLDATFHTVLLKALLVHGASWGDAADLIARAFPEAATPWQKMASLKQQFLGYGEVEISRCLAPTEQRATLLGWGTIADGEGHQFLMPLPPSLAASTELRRLTATLAWLTPTNLRHKDYRLAQLWISVPPEEIGTSTDGLDSMSARRGTVEHRTFEGTDAKAFVDGAKLRITVNCKEDAGSLDVPVPYAIAVTLEVGPGVQIDVYQEIGTRIRLPIGIQAVS